MICRIMSLAWGLILVTSQSLVAVEHVITSPLTVTSSEKSPVIVSPYHFSTQKTSESDSKSLVLYTADYSIIQKKLSNYAKAYGFGQAVHGSYYVVRQL